MREELTARDSDDLMRCFLDEKKGTMPILRDAERLRALFLGSIFLLGVLGLGIQFHWPTTYLGSMLFGMALGVVVELRRRKRTNFRRLTWIGLTAPLIGILLKNVILLVGGVYLLLLVGGFVLSVLMVMMFRDALLGEPPPRKASRELWQIDPEQMAWRKPPKE